MTHKAVILQALRDAGPRGVTNVELNDQLRIYRYSARIHELREKGHTIRTIPVEGALVRFVLEQEAPAVSPGPGPETPSPPPGPGSDEMAVPPGGSTQTGLNDSASGGTGQLFHLEFDEIVPPLSPYDVGSAA